MLCYIHVLYKAFIHTIKYIRASRCKCLCYVLFMNSERINMWIRTVYNNEKVIMSHVSTLYISVHTHQIHQKSYSLYVNHLENAFENLRDFFSVKDTITYCCSLDSLIVRRTIPFFVNVFFLSFLMCQLICWRWLILFNLFCFIPSVT